MDFLFGWFVVVSLTLLAAMSPGPDFVIAIRNSISYSRKTGLFTALGFGLGVCVHVTYCILGIAAVISQSVMLFSIIKGIGAAYLIYIGCKALLSKGYEGPVPGNRNTEKKNDISIFQAIGNGFLTNLLNPKATMYFLALFTQVIDPDTALSTQIIYGASAAITIVLWFSLVAIVLTNRRVKAVFLNFSKWIDRICGGLLIALGIRLALSKGLGSS